MADYKPPFHLTEEIMSLAMEIGESIGAIMIDSTMSPDPKLRRESRVRSIYSSLAIEQNTLSLDQVTAVIDGKRILGPPKDIQEVKNAYEAYEHMSSYDPYSMEDLLTVHRYMMKELVPEAGCFRSGNVGVFHGDQLVHAGTPAKFVPEVMAQLFAWLRTTSMHPLIKSCVFHYEFEFIHPFSDGNGRTGRLWHSLILQRWKPSFLWLPIETLIQEKQEGYYKALNESNNLNECTPFVTFMLEVIRDALAEIMQNQKAFIPTNGGINVGIKTSGDVGINREAVIKILKKQPHSTAKSLAEAMNLSPRQVERVLAELKKEGKIVRKGSNKSGWWEVN